MKKLQLLMEPVVKDYSSQTPFNASGLLVALVNDDKMKYLQNPYIEWPTLKYDGEYEVKVYESKTKKDEYASFTIHYSSKKETKEDVGIQGMFKSQLQIVEYEKSKTIRCNKKDKYTKNIINKVLEYAKTNNINVVWEEIK